jgi:hypothetical protein
MTFLTWVLGLSDETNAAIDAQVATEEGLTMTRLLNSWEQRGLERGLEQGRRELVLHLLERRCGPLDDDVRERIGRLTGRQIANLAEALLDFTGRADLDRWLARRVPRTTRTEG